MVSVSFAVLNVALYTSAWIEIHFITSFNFSDVVALYTSAWIEIHFITSFNFSDVVALYTSAWIEITHVQPP